MEYSQEERCWGEVLVATADINRVSSTGRYT